MAQTKSQSWAKRAERVFNDIERAEGERLFTEDAVTLVSATARKIVAHVMAEDADEVVIEETRGGVSAECACPVWEAGTPCRHMWAAILAADMDMASKSGAATAHQSSPTPVEAVPPAASSASAPVWRDLLFPTAIKASPEERPGGPEYYVCYELRVENNAIRFHALKYRRLKSGKLGKSVKIGREMLRNRSLAPQDQAILGFILGARLNEAFLRHGYLYDTYGVDFEGYRPDSAALSYLLPKLVATGRCSLALENMIQAHALRPGGVGRLEWVGEGEGARTYEAQIRLDARTISLQDAYLFFNTTPVMFVHEGLLHSLPDVTYDWIMAMRRRKGKVRVPKGEMRALVLAVLDEPSAPPIDIPADLMPAPRPNVTITPCLELTMDKAGVWTRMWFDYGGFEVAYDDPRPQMLDVDSWTRIERDRVRELELVEEVADLDLDPVGAAPLDPANLWSRLDQLRELGWIMRSRDKRRIHSGRMGAIRVSSGMDWFDLEGDVDFGDVVVPLPVAVRAYLRGETMVDLGNGETGLLPQDWLAQHARMLELGDTGRAKDDALHFHSAHAQLLDELLEQCPDQPRDFLELRQKFKTFAGVTPPEPPAAFTGTLRPYQREALGWFDFLASFGFGGVLADDMGLGKTIQALAWMALGQERGVTGPNLVVAPTSLLFNWRDEAGRFAPGLRVLTYAGSGRGGLETHFQDHDLILTTYGLLRRDVEILRETPWRCVILDESQAIKNPDSQTAKAARLLPAEHRLCLTGTPLENRVDELWSQMQFLNPGLLGSRQSFEHRFAKPLAQGDTEAKDMLQRFLKPFLLRRTKDAVAKDLPDKQESIIHCEMTEAQAKIYERLHVHYRAEILAAVETKGLQHSQIKVLEGLLRLRQAACHPALVGEEGAGSGKLEELATLVADVVAEGHKALIFSQFTRFLSHIRAKLREIGVDHEYLDGRTPLKTREKRVASFQSPDGPPVFCISLKAGGVGLNLTAADYVFIMDPWWNPAVEAQAVNRAHRIGQDKKVFAYRLISQDSIDEKVLALQQEKKDLADALLDGATTSIGALTKEDLERLLA